MHKLLCGLACLCFCAATWAAQPVIFDTDMGNDVDDALALAILHTLTDRGECELIGVTLTNANPAAVPYVRMVNRFYGRPDLPVGAALRSLKGGADDSYLSAALKTAPAEYRREEKAETAVQVLRRLLAQSKEKVVIVQVGFSTNLAALLESKTDGELVKSKVALVSAMAGDFSGGKPEYNVKIDVPSAKAVFERWPTPVVFSGFEIGRDLLFPAASIEKDFSYARWHPVAESYRAYKKMPYNRPTWDLTAALQAVRPDRHYFETSPAGSVTVDASGNTHFEANPTGTRRYLKLDPASRPRVIEALTLLSSEPPLRR